MGLGFRWVWVSGTGVGVNGMLMYGLVGSGSFRDTNL